MDERTVYDLPKPSTTREGVLEAHHQHLQGGYQPVRLRTFFATLSLRPSMSPRRRAPARRSSAIDDPASSGAACLIADGGCALERGPGDVSAPPAHHATRIARAPDRFEGAVDASDGADDGGGKGDNGCSIRSLKRAEPPDGEDAEARRASLRETLARGLSSFHEERRFGA